jgi:hypothetical protein
MQRNLITRTWVLSFRLLNLGHNKTRDIPWVCAIGTACHAILLTTLEELRSRYINRLPGIKEGHYPVVVASCQG